jgi:excisionase family DNA binding protein
MTRLRGDEDRLLNVKEAAAMLSMKGATLYQWAYQRRLPTVKLYGRSLRFRLSVIQGLMRKFDRPALRPIADGPGEDLD